MNKLFLKIIILITLFSIQFYKFQKVKPCIPVKKCDQHVPSKRYIFVGKKIDVSFVDTTLYCGNMQMNSKYKAVYKIDQELGEHYPKSIINFIAYDHNSMYEYHFENYVNILVFVGEYCDDLIKDAFFPVYKTIDGRWATPVDNYMEPYYKSNKVKPTNINFNKSLSFDFPEDLSAQQLEWRFPKKYYKIKDGKAYPVMGRYVEDLVKLWNEISD